MYDNIKEVYFDEYCATCKNYILDESDDKCHYCLQQPFNYNSHKPINYEETFFDIVNKKYPNISIPNLKNIRKEK